MTVSFSELGLANPILKALDAENYVTPTPIQMQAIPPALEGRDIFGVAQTGTGKTAAFALPIIDRLLAERQRAPAKGCRALILSPTRELASQIAKTFQAQGRFTKLTVTTVFGGVGANPQIRALSRGVDILVATPGRLLDHIRSGHCDLSNTGILVLDEADQMLDLGFLKPIQSIAAKTSRDRQSLFFSATFPKEIEVLSRQLLREPVSVRVAPVATTAERVNQRVIHVERTNKGTLLVGLLDDPALVRTLVFTRTKRGADQVTKLLTKNGLKADAIHGNKSQNQRQRTLEAFRVAKIDVLVATDVAARGIDIADVSHVVNFDLPEVPEAYVHRIGRTARAGRSGEAISLCDPSERKLLAQIERTTKQKIPFERHVAAARLADGDPKPVAAEAHASARPSRKTDRAETRDGGEPANLRRPRRHKPGQSKRPGSGDQANGHQPTQKNDRKDGAAAKQQTDTAARKARPAEVNAKRPRRNKSRTGGQGQGGHAPRSKPGAGGQRRHSKQAPHQAQRESAEA